MSLRVPGREVDVLQSKWGCSAVWSGSPVSFRDSLTEPSSGAFPMSQIDALLNALHDDPGDQTAWLALADALEEAGQPDRAELTRLTCQLRTLPFGQGYSEQQRAEDLAERVLPCVPEVVNSIGMRFGLIPAGRFLMGSARTSEEKVDCGLTVLRGRCMTWRSAEAVLPGRSSGDSEPNTRR